MNWSFKGRKIRESENPVCYRWDEKASIVVTDGEYEMVLDYYNSIDLPDGYEGSKTLAFYSRDLETDDLMEEAIEDLKQNYINVRDQLDLYVHYPTLDDSRAGRVFCSGEEIAYFNGCLVLSTYYAMDI